MSMRLGRQRPLRDISRDLADSDPRLDELFCCFNRHVSGEEMPRSEKIKSKPLAWIARIGRQVRPTAADIKGQVAWYW